MLSKDFPDDIFIIKGFQTIVFISIVIFTTFRPICPPAFFRCLTNSGTYAELRTTSFIESSGVACSDSVSQHRVQVLSIPVLLLACRRYLLYTLHVNINGYVPFLINTFLRGIISLIKSHWVPNSHGLVPHMSKTLSILLISLTNLSPPLVGTFFTQLASIVFC